MTSLQDKLNALPAKRRKAVDERAQELITESMTLADLRKALTLTQVELSEKLHIKQEGISRLERRSDLLLSTLRSYISAMGGELKLTAEFPDRPPVNLQGFEYIAHDMESEK